MQFRSMQDLKDIATPVRNPVLTPPRPILWTCYWRRHTCIRHPSRDIGKPSDIPRRYLIYFLAVSRYFPCRRLRRRWLYDAHLYGNLREVANGTESIWPSEALNKKESKKGIGRFFFLVFWWMYAVVKGVRENRIWTVKGKRNSISSLTLKRKT